MEEGCEIYEWEKRNIYGILLAKTVGRNNLEDLSLDGIVVLKWVLKE